MKYSVVVPTRNRRALLSETIASVMGQDCQDLELIVVDDASTDDTREYLEGLAWPRLKMVALEEHAERSTARNRGFELAEGKYVMFLDDDDLLRPEALHLLGAALEEHPEASMATGGLRFLERNGDSTLRQGVASRLTVRAWELLMLGWWANSGQNLFRTEAAKATGGFPAGLSACEDRDFLLKINRGAACVFIPEVVLHYRLHGGQSKPADLDELRELVYEQHLASLGPAERKRGEALRRTGKLLTQGGRSAVLKACLQAPWLSWHPVLGKPVRSALWNGRFYF